MRSKRHFRDMGGGCKRQNTHVFFFRADLEFACKARNFPCLLQLLLIRLWCTGGILQSSRLLQLSFSELDSLESTKSIEFVEY